MAFSNVAPVLDIHAPALGIAAIVFIIFIPASQFHVFSLVRLKPCQHNRQKLLWLSLGRQCSGLDRGLRLTPEQNQALFRVKHPMACSLAVPALAKHQVQSCQQHARALAVHIEYLIVHIAVFEKLSFHIPLRFQSGLVMG